MITFGDMLYASPFIPGEPARSLGINCSTCHNNGDVNQFFFIPGISHQPGAADVRGSFFNPMFNDHRRKSLDRPSLRGLRYTARYGNDGRFSSLAEFTRNVIVNEFAGPGLLEFGAAPRSFFDRLLFAGGDEQAIQAVASGLVDAAGATQYSELLLSPEQQMAVIWISETPLIPSHGVVSPEGLDGDVRDRFVAAMLKLNEPEHQGLLQHVYSPDGYIAPDPSACQGVRQLAHAYGLLG